jgi:hypothetical protein
MINKEQPRADWFQESICELASLFFLKELSEIWKARPPYSNWRDYANSIAEYADNRLQEASYLDKENFSEYFSAKEEHLRE